MNCFVTQLRKELMEQRLVLLVLPIVCALLSLLVTAAVPHYQRAAVPPLAATFAALVACTILTADLLAGDRHRGVEAFTDRLPGSRRALPIAKLLTLTAGLAIPSAVAFLASALSAEALGATVTGHTLDTSNRTALAQVTLAYVGLSGFVVLATRSVGRTLLGIPTALFALALVWVPVWQLGDPTEEELARGLLIATASGLLAWPLAFFGRRGRKPVLRIAASALLLFAPGIETTAFWIQLKHKLPTDADVSVSFVLPTEDPRFVDVVSHFKTEERGAIPLHHRLDLATGTYERTQAIDEVTLSQKLLAKFALPLGMPSHQVKQLLQRDTVRWTARLAGGAQLDFEVDAEQMSFIDPLAPEPMPHPIASWHYASWAGAGLFLGFHRSEESPSSTPDLLFYDPFVHSILRQRGVPKSLIIRPESPVVVSLADPRAILRAECWHDGSVHLGESLTSLSPRQSFTGMVDPAGRLLIHSGDDDRLQWFDPATLTWSDELSHPVLHHGFGKIHLIEENGAHRVTRGSYVGWLRDGKFHLTERAGHLLRLEPDRALFLQNGHLVWQPLETMR